MTGGACRCRRRCASASAKTSRAASSPTCASGILDAGALHDVGREQDPENDALYTWWAPWRNMRQRNIGWRLDYVLASAPLAARTARCVSMREFGTSDHAPVVATFAGDAPS